MSINGPDDELVGVAAVGTRTKLTDSKRMQFDIHNLVQMPLEKSVQTPSIWAHGRNWFLEFYPRGYGRDYSDEVKGTFAFFLYCDASSPVGARFSVKMGPLHWKPLGFHALEKIRGQWVFNRFVKRDTLLNPANGYLDDDGTLTIHVWVQVQASPTWYPKLPPSHTHESALLHQLLASKERADGTFLVDGKIFPVHKCVLAVGAKVLLDLLSAEDKNDGEETWPTTTTTTEIDEVSAATFQGILSFVYTGAVVPECCDSASNAKSLLQAADRFGITSLKLHTESVLVDKFLDEDNAAELLLLSDALSCALLKEHAMDLCLSKPTKVRASAAWAMVEDSPKLLSEMLAQSMHATTLSSTDSGSELHHLRVADLRDRLMEQGLDVDGSRKMLLDRLVQGNDNDDCRVARSSKKQRTI
jgi:BTB/POZ domain